MTKQIFLILVAAILPGYIWADEAAGPTSDAAAAVFEKAYPDAFEGVHRENNEVYLKFRGHSFRYDDHVAKTEEEAMATPDIEDTLKQIYPLGPSAKALSPNADPGRIRSQPLLEVLYGSTEGEVRSDLVPVDFVGSKVAFNRQQGAADALAAAGRELEKLAKEHPEIQPYFEKLGGSFNWRPIAGTNRLSAHSFGIAVDLNPDLARYWRWDEDPSSYRPDEFPFQIVEAFERHGFIWGGKWSHYDSMHFEYRPELILLAKQASTKP